jgi:hypothetical protein
MINSIGSNFAINIKQNSQSSRNTPPKIQPQLRSDSVSFGSKEFKPEAISLLSEHAAEWWAKKLNDGAHPPEKITIFKETLKESIANVINNLEERVRRLGLYLGVEKQPGPLLSEALAKAGIEKTALPQQTKMYIHPLQVQVNDSSGVKSIYQLPEELKP